MKIMEGGIWDNNRVGNWKDWEGIGGEEEVSVESGVMGSEVSSEISEEESVRENDDQENLYEMIERKERKDNYFRVLILWTIIYLIWYDNLFKF